MYFKCWRVLLSCLASLLASVCLGMISYYASPAFPDINNGNYGFKLSNDMLSWLASLPGLFSMVGSFIVVPLMDNYGRKFAFFMSTIPLFTGWLLTLVTFNVPTLITARCIMGIADGMVATVVAPYIAEIAPKQMRGVLMMLFMNSIYFGGFCTNLFGTFINWRWLALLCLTTATATSLSALFMFETPRWLVSRGHKETATEVIIKLWNMKSPDVIAKEIQDIENNLKLVPEIGIFPGLLQLVSPLLRKPFVVTQLLLIFQQFTGYGYIINYTVFIFQEATLNFKTTDPFFKNPNYQSCLVTLANIFGSILSMLFIDRYGRRVLLMISSTTVTISLVGVGAYYYMQTVNVLIAEHYLYWLPVTCLIVYNLGYSFAFGGIPFLLLSELFPMHVRGITNGIGSIVQNLCWFVVVKVFLLIPSSFNYGIFWVYAGFAFLSTIFVFFFVPETKGKSLEEIQQQLYSSNLTNSKTDSMNKEINGNVFTVESES